MTGDDESGFHGQAWNGAEMTIHEYLKGLPKEQRRDYFKRLGELRNEGFTRWRHGQNMEQWLDTLPPEFREPGFDSTTWVWFALSLLTAGAGTAAQILGYLNLATILWVAWWAVFATITWATWASILLAGSARHRRKTLRPYWCFTSH